MKKLSALLLALTVCAIPALAGESETPNVIAGTDCVNECPLAEQANHRMATGTEALRVSSTIRKDFVDAMLLCAEAI